MYLRDYEDAVKLWLKKSCMASDGELKEFSESDFLGMFSSILHLFCCVVFQGPKTLCK